MKRHRVKMSMRTRSSIFKLKMRAIKEQKCHFYIVSNILQCCSENTLFLSVIPTSMQHQMITSLNNTVLLLALSRKNISVYNT